MTAPLAFALSVLVEAPLAAALVRGLRWGSAWRAAAAAALGTTVTHPVVWQAIPALADRVSYWPGLALAEAGVVLVEGVAYLFLVPLSPGRALLASLAANAASTGFGLALYALDLA